jgi:hypothetical protein
VNDDRACERSDADAETDPRDQRRGARAVELVEALGAAR